MVLDLSSDDSSGAEFSLILFSFSKECLTGNHHRSRHTEMPCPKRYRCSGLPTLWEVQGTAWYSPRVNGEQCAWAPDVGAWIQNIYAPGPEGTGCMYGSSSHIQQHLSTWVLGVNHDFLTYAHWCFRAVSDHKRLHWKISCVPYAIPHFCGDTFSGCKPWTMLLRNVALGIEKRAHATITVGLKETSIDVWLSVYFGMVRTVRHPQHSCSCQCLSHDLLIQDTFAFTAYLGKEHAPTYQVLTGSLPI